MMRFIYKIICILFHFGNYIPDPTLDYADKKGVYCKKCQVSFKVSDKVFCRIFKI